MIGIELPNNKNVELAPGTKVALEFNNPIFDDAVIQGDYSLAINAPTKANSPQFGFNHRLHLKNRQRSYADVKLKYKQAPLAKAILDVNSIDDDFIGTSLRLNISSLQCMTRKLRDFDYAGMRDLGSTMADVITSCNAIAAQSYPDTDFNFPMIYNPEFYGTNNPDFEGFVNNYESGVGYYDNTPANRNCLVPMAYLHYIIKQGFAFDGYTVKNAGFMADEIMQKLIVYNNVALDKRELTTGTAGMRAECTTNPVLNSNVTLFPIIFNNDSSGGYYDALSAYNNGTGFYTIAAAGNHLINVQLRLKFFNNTQTNTTDTVIVKIFRDSSPTPIASVTKNYYAQTFVTLNLTTNYNPATGGEKLSVSVYYVNSNVPTAKMSLQGSSFFAVNDFSTTSNQNVFNGQFELNDHVPDILFGDLLNAIKKTFFLTYKFDHIKKEVSVLYIDDLLEMPYKDFSKKSVYGHSIQLTNDNAIRSFNFTFGGDDDLETDNFKYYDPALYLGSYTAWNVLNTLVPPTALVAGKYAHIKTLHQIFKCNDIGSGAYRWEYYTDAFFDKVINESGTIDVRPALSPMLMKQHYYGTSNEFWWISPQISQTGSSNEFELGPHDYSFKLMFLHGLTGWAGLDIPFSSSTGLHYDGSEEFASAMAWEDWGLLQYGLNFIAMLLTGEFFEKRIRLTLPDLQTFDINMIPRLDNENFIVKGMKIEVGDELGEAVFTLMRIKRGLPDISSNPDTAAPTDFQFVASGSKFVKIQMLIDSGAAISIDWGDGSTTTGTGSGTYVDYSHSYGSMAHFTVKVTCTGIKEIYSYEDPAQILSIASLPNGLEIIDLSTQYFTALPPLPTSLYDISFSNGKLKVYAVSRALAQLDANGLTNGFANFTGQVPDAVPNTNGQSAKANLITKGWSISTD